MTLQPVFSPGVTSRLFAAGDGIPNNPQLPAVVLTAAFVPAPEPVALHRLIRANGWGGLWTWSIFRFHHYHPNAFELLVVQSGSGRVVLGGPSGESFEVAAGDAIALPPGTGHCLADATADFTVSGAYPPGQEDYETLRAGEAADIEVATRIARVPRPATDPIFGADGPILSAWRS